MVHVLLIRQGHLYVVGIGFRRIDFPSSVILKILPLPTSFSLHQLLLDLPQRSLSLPMLRQLASIKTPAEYTRYY